MKKLNSQNNKIFRPSYLLLILLFAISSSSWAQESDKPGDATPLNLIVTEMSFQLDGQEKNAPITFQSGTTYDLHIKNEGKILHEVQFGRDPDMSSGLAHDYKVLLFANTEVVTVINDTEIVSPGMTEVVLKPGQEVHVLFTLEEANKGEWEVACFQPGHYEAGMHAPVIVN